jgi:hypothetical protein
MNLRTWSSLAQAATLAFTLSAHAVQNDSGAKQSMKNAGTETKEAAHDAGHSVKQGTKKAYYKTKHATKKAVRKTKDEINEPR